MDNGPKYYASGFAVFVAPVHHKSGNVSMGYNVAECDTEHNAKSMAQMLCDHDEMRDLIEEFISAVTPTQKAELRLTQSALAPLQRIRELLKRMGQP